jgi:hypothetical protein
MQTRFIDICFLLIVLLLLVIACRPLFQPTLTQAAGPVQYKLVVAPEACAELKLTSLAECAQALNNQGKDGWRIENTWAVPTTTGGQIPVWVLVR